VTPSWPAIYNNLDEDWQTANDPCMIELGSSWRIPTYTEWSDVFNAGNWFGNLVPWFSDLKMHAAGYLSVGQLMKRGQEGFYWSDTQSNLTIGWMLHTDAFTYNSIDGHYKPNGFTLRCLRD